MSLFIKIIDVHAREILDSRGNPTVEVEVTAETETTGKKIHLVYHCDNHFVRTQNKNYSHSCKHSLLPT